MTLFHKEYALEQFSRILSWSPESRKVLKPADVAEWCTRTPNFSTFRVNTLCYTVEECISHLRDEFLQKFSIRSTKLPEIHGHDKIPECIVIGKLNEDALDLSRKKEEVIVDAICGAAVLRGADIFSAGIIGMLPTARIGSEVSIFADLTATCLKGYKQIFENEGKLFLGNGIILKDRRELFDGAPFKRGIAVQLRNPISGLLMPELHANMGVLQNLPSMVSVKVLDPKPSEVVLDMCAAPGNKTTHIGTLMKDQGILVAIDRKSKVYSVATNCEVINLKNCIRIYAGNSTKIVGDLERQLEEGPPFPPNTFDKILLDAPCSGSGLRPMLFNRITNEERTRSFSQLQKKLVDNAVALLKRGGTLVYSTCSVLCEENECLVAWTLEKYPQMRLVSAEPVVGGPGLSDCGLSDEQRSMVQRFGMNEEEDSIDSIGFFIAKFAKE